MVTAINSSTGTPSTGNTKDLSAQIARIQKQISALQKQLAEVQKETSDAAEKQAELIQQQIVALQARIAQLEAQQQMQSANQATQAGRRGGERRDLGSDTADCGEQQREKPDAGHQRRRVCLNGAACLPNPAPPKAEGDETTRGSGADKGKRSVRQKTKKP